MATTLHLTADGTGNGASWAQARALSDFAQALTEAGGPDGALRIGFPQEREAPWFWKGTQAEAEVAGTRGRPFQLHFGLIGGEASLAPARPGTGYTLLRRAAQPFPLQTRPDPNGKSFMTFKGCSDLEISGPSFEGAGAKGFFRFAGRGADITVRDLHARMAGRVLETAKGTVLNDVTIENCSGYGLIRGFARFHELSNARFRNLDLDAAHMDGGGKLVCQLISVVKGTNFLFEGVHLRNAANLIDAEARGSTFVQGDGIVLEEDTSNARFVNCHARDCGDAGFDLKCDGIQLESCSMSGCKYGVRVWRNSPGNLLSGCHISMPHPRPFNAAACIWLGGQVTLADCSLTPIHDTAAIRFGKGPDTTDRVAVMIGGAIDTRMGGDLLAGEPGRLEMHNVAINGEQITGTAIWTGRELLRG